jgi:hypothetical protein
MKKLLMFLLISSLIVSCNQKSEEPKYQVNRIADLAPSTKESFYKNGDTVGLASVKVTKTVLIPYTYSFDSFYQYVKPFQGSTVPTPPVDTPVTTPPVITPGLTSYGTILSYNKFDVLSPEQLGKGKVITDPVNPNNKVFSAIVNKGDAAISSGWRSEQNWPSTPKEGGVEFDAYFITTNPNSLILQIHGETQGTGGPVSIQMSGTNKLQIVLSTEKGVNTYLPINNFTITYKKWYHFRVEFLLDNPGYFKLIIDGNVVSDAEEVRR